MSVLLDVNVLVALAWPNHIHHAAAIRWFEKLRRRGWATCPLTQGGFIRVSSNHRILPEAKSPWEAILLLRRLTDLERHVFWMDDIDWTRSELIAPERIVGHRQVTDAHLIALAIRHRGRLATFDRGVVEVLPPTAKASNSLVFLS